MAPVAPVAPVVPVVPVVLAGRAVRAVRRVRIGSDRPGMGALAHHPSATNRRLPDTGKSPVFRVEGSHPRPKIHRANCASEAGWPVRNTARRKTRAQAHRTRMSEITRSTRVPTTSNHGGLAATRFIITKGV